MPAAISVHNYCQGVPVTERPKDGQTLTSTKMGLHEWAYSNDYSPVARQKMTHVDMPLRFSKMTIEVEQGFTADQTAAEVERCLNCDVQTRVHRFAVHRMRRVHRHLSHGLFDDCTERRGTRAAHAPDGAGR